MSVHPTHRMHAHSHAAFAEIEHGTRAMEVLLKLGDETLTDRQILARFAKVDMNHVRPRISDLHKAGVLKEGAAVPCDATRAMVRTSMLNPDYVAGAWAAYHKAKKAEYAFTLSKETCNLAINALAMDIRDLPTKDVPEDVHVQRIAIREAAVTELKAYRDKVAKT